MKLYPPIIEGSIPAFTNNTLIVPFTMNKSVSENEILNFELKLKTKRLKKIIRLTKKYFKLLT